MDDKLQDFVNAVDAICYDFDTHHIDIDYEFYGSLNLRMLLQVCNYLSQDGKITSDMWWLQNWDV